MYDIIVIGAGPAGLTAALYALRANQKVLVLEAKTYGGQIINAHKIDNYPGMKGVSGFDLATNIYNQVKELGVEYKTEEVLEIKEDKTVVTAKDKYQAKAIIIATGAENISRSDRSFREMFLRQNKDIFIKHNDFIEEKQ